MWNKPKSVDEDYYLDEIPIIMQEFADINKTESDPRARNKCIKFWVV